MKNRILLMLLSLLGFASACDDETAQYATAMYGTPSFDFRAQGKVTDAAGNPVANIAVSSGYRENQEGTARTSPDGSYDISGKGFPYKADLVFTDTDGPDNGGEFAQKQLKVEFTEADRTGQGDGSGWYSGIFARKDVNVTLEEKTAEEE